MFPYLYTQFYLSSTQGLPLMRPLWYEFPVDPSTNELDSQFMLGPCLLIAPKLTPMLPRQFMKTVSYQVPTYFPEEAIWYYWYDRVPVRF